MSNRLRLGSWPIVPDAKVRPEGTPLFISADRVAGGDRCARLCQAWRAWESGASARQLGWLLAAPHQPGSGAGPPLWEEWVYFASASCELDDLALRGLAPRIQFLKANTALRIVISGRDTLPGPSACGMGLGLRRVLAIWNVLLAFGIDPARILITVRGARWSVAETPTKPPAKGEISAECRFQVTDPRWGLARN